jgi:hypothetical protein
MMLRRVDRTKPIWRVVGHLPAPDGRRTTIFCNAESEAKARTDALREMGSITRVERVTIEQMEK